MKALEAQSRPQDTALSGDTCGGAALDVGSVPSSVQSTQRTANGTSLAGPGCPAHV